jgi:hypothetical protein
VLRVLDNADFAARLAAGGIEASAAQAGPSGRRPSWSCAGARIQRPGSLSGRAVWQRRLKHTGIAADRVREPGCAAPRHRHGGHAVSTATSWFLVTPQ